MSSRGLLVALISISLMATGCPKRSALVGPPSPEAAEAVHQDMQFVARYVRLLDDHLSQRADNPDKPRVLRLLDTLCAATDHILADPVTYGHPLINERMPDFAKRVRSARLAVEGDNEFGRAATIKEACTSCHDLSEAPFLPEELPAAVPRSEDHASL